MDCPSCNKTLYSENALKQHYLAKHGRHLCMQCFNTFGSERSLEQHSDDKHRSSTTPSFKNAHFSHSHDDPYPGIEGYWISRDSYRGSSKSFGWFECNSCRKTWFSAHAQKRFRQGCQKCEEESHPCCLWVNTGYDDRVRNEDKDHAPHDRARCEACRKGYCLECKFPRRR